MKAIPENFIDSIIVSSEQTNYPAINLMDEHPKKQWKADANVYSASLDIIVLGDNSINSLAIFNLSADSVEVAIEDPNNTEWESDTEWETGSEITGGLLDGSNYLADGAGYLIDGSELPGTLGGGVQWAGTAYDETLIIFGSEDFSGTDSLWVEFESFATDIEFRVTLYIDDPAVKTISAGVVIAGTALNSNNPVYGLTEALHDYSITRELSNGAIYVKQRDIVRLFNGSLMVDRDDDFYDFMNLAKRNGKNPIAWRITDLGGFRWVVYARHLTMPVGQHVYPETSIINFDLIEVL